MTTTYKKSKINKNKGAWNYSKALKDATIAWSKETQIQDLDAGEYEPLENPCLYLLQERILPYW
jgi:hypothetical protein